MKARLARWLGPWADPFPRPGVDRKRVRIVGSEPFDAWVYRPIRRPVRGALLVVPGLHYLGPADPRLDRFISIVADAGILALCPLLPEFRRLTVGPSLVGDTLAAYDALRELPDVPHGRPGVFSISFGSHAALHVGAERDPSALVLFGGYAIFEDAIRFSLEGNPGRPHDPLNRPVIFLNMIEHLVDLPEDREPLRRAFVEFTRRTWGSDAMKAGGWRAVAHDIEGRLPEAYRKMFTIGVGDDPLGLAIIRDAMERGRETLAHLDPRPVCPRVRCPITIVHGQDDDVIPHTHARMLAEAIPAAKVILTGLYAHTGSSTIDPRLAIQEVSAMLGILDAIIGAAAPF